MPPGACLTATHVAFFLDMRTLHRNGSRRRVGTRLTVTITALALLAACDDEPSGPSLTAVTSGTIGGIPFTVTGGTVYQIGADGPVRADSTGGRIELDRTPAELGMSDPDLLHVRTYFAIAQGGSLGIGAFGDPADPFGTGVSIEIARTAVGFVHELRFGGSLSADSTFAAQPVAPGAEQWLVTELYADSVPGAPAGAAGAALWPLDDLTPTAAEEILGCRAEPSTDPTPLTGEAVGYALDDAWLLDVEIVDQVVGPCS